jgi:hypothetical protein
MLKHYTNMVTLHNVSFKFITLESCNNAFCEFPHKWIVRPASSPTNKLWDQTKQFAISQILGTLLHPCDALSQNFTEIYNICRKREETEEWWWDNSPSSIMLFVSDTILVTLPLSLTESSSDVIPIASVRDFWR